MDRRLRQYNTELDFLIHLGEMRINVLCVNYEAPVPGWGYELHSHSSYEFHFIPRGAGDLWVGGKRHRIEPGTLYLTGPGVFHEQKADLQDPMVEFCLNLEILPPRPAGKDVPSRLAEEEEAMLAALSATSFWFGRDRFPSASLFEEVFRELEGGRLGSYARIRNLLCLIVINAIRNLAPEGASPSALPRKALHESRRFLIDRYFDQASEPNREELASLVAMSVRQLNRILEEYYGMSFTEKLNHGRLEKAAVLLRSSELGILQISDRLGFSSQGYFSSRFRARYGAPPAQFRKRYREFANSGHAGRSASRFPDSAAAEGS